MLEQILVTPLEENVQSSWDAWLRVTRDRCHLHFFLEGGTLERHIAASYASANITTSRMAEGLNATPLRILEIGCSTGFNCIALACQFPSAEVHGIEPDGEAVAVAQSMAKAANVGNVYFTQGVGENLPFEAGTFDLIICLTVIEHVNDVERVIAEMSRVLSPTGSLRIEAPNYIWPYEPHLGIWCVPLLGKRLAKVMAVIQGKADKVAYLQHLKFVTPSRLERAFRENGLCWSNLVIDKLERILSGDTSQVLAYKRVATLFGMLGRVGLTSLLVRLLMWSKLYPSVLYTAKKSKCDKTT